MLRAAGSRFCCSSPANGRGPRRAQVLASLGCLVLVPPDLGEVPFEVCGRASWLLGPPAVLHLDGSLEPRVGLCPAAGEVQLRVCGCGRGFVLAQSG